MREEQLKFLKEISRTKSITAASTHLNITPQALSSSIKTLEKEMEFRILNRSNQGVSLTAEGLKLLIYANDFFEALEKVRLDKDQQKRREKLTLPVTKEASFYFLLPLIKAIANVHNHLKLDIRMASVEELKKEVLQQKIAGFFCIVPEYEGEFFFDEDERFKHHILKPIGRLSCLIPKTMMLCDFKTASLKTLVNYPSLFRRTKYEDVGSVFYMLNKIIPITDYQFIDDAMEYKANLLIGDRIGYEFINAFSEWHNYSDIVTIIQLKEKLSLHLSIVTSAQGNLDPFWHVLRNTELEQVYYKTL